jgi:hypothetical protein
MDPGFRRDDDMEVEMAKRLIQFEIDDEIASHFDWLVEDWKKDPVWLARAFFEEEVKSHVAGSRGVPLLRRFMYRDASPYFTPEECEARSAEREARRDHVQEAKDWKETLAMFAKMEANRRKRA